MMSLRAVFEMNQVSEIEQRIIIKARTHTSNSVLTLLFIPKHASGFYNVNIIEGDKIISMQNYFFFFSVQSD